MHGSPYIVMKEMHGMGGTPIYNIWMGIKARCLNPNYPRYEYYGGRGIKVCDRWKNSFNNFYVDMGKKPEGMEIDRIDNNGDYEPNNCRWVTHAENCRNTRKTILSMELAGKIRKLRKKRLMIKEIADKLKIKNHNVKHVLYDNCWK